MQGKSPEIRVARQIRVARPADVQRIRDIRNGASENRLSDPARVTEGEIRWYLEQAIFLVCEDDCGVQGFVCANHQSGLLWALFVADDRHGRGYGKALLESALTRLAERGHRQAFLTTEPGTRALDFYRRQGWIEMGTTLGGEAALIRYLDFPAPDR